MQLLRKNSTVYLFNFNYPLFAPYGTKIDGMSIIKVPTPDGDRVISRGDSKVSMGEIKAVCYHIFMI